MKTRPLALTILLAAFAGTAHAQFGDFLRSVTGALGGKSSSSQQQQGVTPTIGIRGIDEGGSVANAPASGDNALLDGWMSTRNEAEQHARSKGLAARDVRFRQENGGNAASN